MKARMCDGCRSGVATQRLIGQGGSLHCCEQCASAVRAELTKQALNEAREASRKVHRGEVDPPGELKFEGVRAYTSKRGER